MAKGKLRSQLHFHDWEQALQQSQLPAHRQESWAITLRWYLSWAKRARVPVDFDSARDFISRMELEKRPSPQRLEQWKEAIRWLFREGKQRQRVSLLTPSPYCPSPGLQRKANFLRDF